MKRCRLTQKEEILHVSWVTTSRSQDHLFNRGATLSGPHPTPHQTLMASLVIPEKELIWMVWGGRSGMCSSWSGKSRKMVKNDRWIRRCKGKQLLQNPSFAKHLWGLHKISTFHSGNINGDRWWSLSLGSIRAMPPRCHEPRESWTSPLQQPTANMTKHEHVYGQRRVKWRVVGNSDYFICITLHLQLRLNKIMLPDNEWWLGPIQKHGPNTTGHFYSNSLVAVMSPDGAIVCLAPVYKMYVYILIYVYIYTHML